MKSPVHYRAMEMLARQHANLDQKTARIWEEEAKLLSKLATNTERLFLLKAAGGEKEKAPPSPRGPGTNSVAQDPPDSSLRFAGSARPSDPPPLPSPFPATPP